MSQLTQYTNLSFFGQALNNTSERIESHNRVKVEILRFAQYDTMLYIITKKIAGEPHLCSQKSKREVFLQKNRQKHCFMKKN